MSPIQLVSAVNNLLDFEVYLKLKEAELEANSTEVRYTHKEVFSSLRAILAGQVIEDNA
jgi:hypothetical protein